MSESMQDFIAHLPSPENLWKQAVQAAKHDSDLCEIKNPVWEKTPEFSLFKIEDGGGAEGTLLAKRNSKGKIDSALLFAYDHESSLTANIEDEEGAANQPALVGIPAEFDPVLVKGSPVFWNYDGYPATFTHIFASAAVWFVDDEWSFAENLEEAEDFDGNPVREDAMVRQFSSIFEGFSL